MENEYKRLEYILLNSEHLKKEKELKTQVKKTEIEVYALREHHQALSKYNEIHNYSVVK